jgi:hypothetical protein
MQLDQYIAALDRDGRLLADAAERGGLAALVPSGATVSGDTEVLLLWRDTLQVRWM